MLDLQPKGQGHGKKKKRKQKHATSKTLSRDPLVNDLQLICQQVMNDLLTIIKVGQHRSRMTRVNYHYCKKVSGK